MTVEEVMEKVEADRIFYENSGGGVTFSGGEPTIQVEFLKGLLEEAEFWRQMVILLGDISPNCFLSWKRCFLT
jgi:pyruvate-formate lyase-activating enzyme